MTESIQTSILKYVYSYESSDSDSEDSYNASLTSCSQGTSDSEIGENHVHSIKSAGTNHRVSTTIQLAIDSPGSSEAGNVSDLNNDPSLPLPSGNDERNARIRKGLYQPRLHCYKTITHNGKKRR